LENIRFYTAKTRISRTTSNHTSFSANPPSSASM
jgi:hypothetical protein